MEEQMLHVRMTVCCAHPASQQRTRHNHMSSSSSLRSRKRGCYKRNKNQDWARIAHRQPQATQTELESEPPALPAPPLPLPEDPPAPPLPLPLLLLLEPPSLGPCTRCRLAGRSPLSSARQHTAETTRSGQRAMGRNLTQATHPCRGRAARQCARTWCPQLACCSSAATASPAWQHRFSGLQL